MTPDSRLLALLVAGHLLADFAFQTRRMVEKKRRLGGLLRHGVVVAIVHAAVAWPFLSPAGGLLVLGIAALHMAIDRAKAMAARPRRLRAFTLDQAAHALVLVAAWLAWTRVPEWPPDLPADLSRLVEPWTTLAVLAAAYAFAWTGGAVIVSGVLERHQLDEGNVRISEEERSRGRTIGILERVILLTLVIVSEWAALGFVIAAKSIARFKDFDDRDFSERYLIGTLVSVLVAIGVGLAVRALLAM